MKNPSSKTEPSYAPASLKCFFFPMTGLLLWAVQGMCQGELKLFWSLFCLKLC